MQTFPGVLFGYLKQAWILYVSYRLLHFIGNDLNCNQALSDSSSPFLTFTSTNTLYVLLKHPQKKKKSSFLLKQKNESFSWRLTRSHKSILEDILMTGKSGVPYVRIYPPLVFRDPCKRFDHSDLSPCWFGFCMLCSTTCQR